LSYKKENLNDETQHQECLNTNIINHIGNKLNPKNINQKENNLTSDYEYCSKNDNFRYNIKEDYEKNIQEIIDSNSANMYLNSMKLKENFPSEDICENIKSNFFDSNNNLGDINSFLDSDSTKQCVSPLKDEVYMNIKKKKFINIREKYNPTGVNNKTDLNSNEYRKENSTFTFSQNESLNSNNYNEKKNFLLNNFNDFNQCLNLYEIQHFNNMRYNDVNIGGIIDNNQKHNIFNFSRK